MKANYRHRLQMIYDYDWFPILDCLAIDTKLHSAEPEEFFKNKYILKNMQENAISPFCHNLQALIN